MASTWEIKVSLGISMLRNLKVPEHSCIAVEIEKIAKKLRIKKAQMSHYRVAVYYGWRKIQGPLDDEKKVFRPMDNHEDSSSLPSEPSDGSA